ncbi:MAG: hypothetical protein CSA97_05325 [Bacteroidetes bacterium]|nr:MAG: hypothetical protein CSA97_05325 [Bacteroidota bacterium]
MKLRIVTPEETLLDQEVKQVILPGTKAPFTIREKHQAIISPLVSGEVVKVLLPNGEELLVEVQGSCIVEDHDDDITILADSAKRVDKFWHRKIKKKK